VEQTLLVRYRAVAQRLARDLQSLRCLLVRLSDGSQRQRFVLQAPQAIPKLHLLVLIHPASLHP
jgi:hypothetical protein